MRILVVDDESNVLADLVRMLREGWESEGAEDALEIVEAGSVGAVRQLIVSHQEDKDWVLDHVFSDGLVKPGGWGNGCQDVYRLVREKGPDRTNPGMTVLSFNPIAGQTIAQELNAGFIPKISLIRDPTLLVRRLFPSTGGSPEMR